MVNWATAGIQGISHIPKDPLSTTDIDILNLLRKGENIHPYTIRFAGLATARWLPADPVSCSFLSVVISNQTLAYFPAAEQVSKPHFMSLGQSRVWQDQCKLPERLPSHELQSRDVDISTSLPVLLIGQ